MVNGGLCWGRLTVVSSTPTWDYNENSFVLNRGQSYNLFSLWSVVMTNSLCD